MKIKTKLTFIIGGGMMILSLIFLLTGTIFSVHEVLLIKRHELKTIARRIDRLIPVNIQKSGRKKLKYDISNGLLFAEKREHLKTAVFDFNGNNIFISNNMLSDHFNMSDYPQKSDNYHENVYWKNWNHWEIDFFYKGNNCYVKMSLLQRLEIQEDISSFFFGSLFLSLALSFIGGTIITSKILKRATRIEKAANQIALGNLKYRIPDSETDDEIREIEKNLNNAFVELEESFEKIMEFSSDIAHELRTPLTIITGEIEVALRANRSAEEYQILVVNILEKQPFCIELLMICLFL